MERYRNQVSLVGAVGVLGQVLLDDASEGLDLLALHLEGFFDD